MRYLIINVKEKQAFETDWFDYDNNYKEGSIVIKDGEISFDGKTFEEIDEDCL